MSRPSREPPFAPGEADAALREPPATGARTHPAARLLKRGPWEMAASLLIALGVVMLMQPFVLWAYTWSFAVTLLGTVMFLVVSHFPD